MPAQWQWGLGVPPASLPSMSGESLTQAPRHPVLPTSSHVPVVGAAAHETVWNPLDGDPIRMAALGASAEVQGLTPVTPVNGKGSGPAKREAEEAVPTATTPPGARLKPVTGRRQREPLPATISITAGSYRSNLAPPSVPPASAAPVRATGEARESEPRPHRPRRVRMLVALVVAVMAAAGAAVAVFITVPPRATLAASLAYEREAGPIDNPTMRDFHQAQEGLLWSEEVRDAAAGLVAKRGADIDVGALGNVRQLMRGARIRWDTNADATRDELTLEYETTAREQAADAERLTALFGALHTAAVAKGSGGRVSDLKLELLETEVNDYTRELDYLTRRLQTLQEELRIVRLGAPEAGEIDGLKNDVSRLSSAYQAALADRIRAEVEAGVAPEPANRPATMPAATDGLPPPPQQVGPTGVEQHRKLERDLLVELRTKERQLAEATAQQEAIEQKEREAKGVTDTIDSLSRSLEEKRKELAEARGSTRAVFKPLAPSPARVIEERDDRPLWIGVAVAVIAFAFAGYVALAREKGGE